MTELIKEIQQWQSETFPGGTVVSILRHLIKETMELYEAIDSSEEPWRIADEIADCIILLIGISGRLNIDILEEVKKKHEKNKLREWGEPDESGVVEHVRKPI